MFQPRYRLTSKLLTNIAAIERSYGRLEGLRLPPELELNLERNNLIKSTYISNSIEGNPLSLPEVTNLLLGDRIPVNKDEKEVKNYFEVLKNLSTYSNKPITLDSVKSIHRQVLTGVKDDIAGVIRNARVVVGGYFKNGGKSSFRVKHEPPSHRRPEIEKAVSELLDWLKKIDEIPTVVKAGIFHHHFVYLHPFEDGNGRACRLLTALIFLKNSYAINKYFVLDDYYDIDRILYSDKLHSADSGNKTEWLEYFSDGVKYSLGGALGRAENALMTLKRDLRPTEKEKGALKIIQELKEATSTEAAQRLSVSRQQAHALLSGLVKKGLLKRKGKTKSRYYFFAS